MDSQIIALELMKIYGSSTSSLVRRLETPPKRLYARVNTLRATREEVLESLLREGVEAHPDDSISDAVYFEVQGPFKFECNASKAIVVDKKTAVSLMLGANLYRPGVIKITSFERGELLLAVSENYIPVACLEAALTHKEAMSLRKGLIGINRGSPYRAPRIAETKAYISGLIYSQSAPSILTSYALDPRKDELVVDMNAAPGGKTGHVVQLTSGRARVVAVDRNERKIEALTTTLLHLGLYLNVLPLSMDSRYIHLDLNLHEKADKVLIDPPCSNLGVRPLLGAKRTLSSVTSLAKYQRQFLKAAWHVLKPGGRLVYSTCTLTLSENEENIAYAVEYLGFSVAELESPPPYSDKVSYRGVTAYRFSPLLADMPGYFIAVLTK
ncbi:MAG: RsmB/NOP family class I SAM-dependent RNA methyltransferase [Desulfurococcaceae archaeon]